MNLHTFVADSVADAVAQIRARLGPQAVVVNVRQIEPAGLSRFWQKPRLEVLAGLPETSAGDMPATSPRTAASPPPRDDAIPAPIVPPAPTLPPLGEDKADFSGLAQSRDYGGWNSGGLLESMGLLPFYAQKVVERLQKLHGAPPESIGEQYHLACSVLRQMWPAPANVHLEPASCHVLIGPPGVGKTTLLCKWLAQSVLMDGLAPRVWRLDGATANTAESLSVYCDILGIPLDRTPSSRPAGDSQPVFVDVPGATLSSSQETQELKERLQTLPQPVLHLVLNAAYEVPLLLAQIRSFSALPVADISFCHLDEERRWGKLWNLVLGTNYSVGFLSAGQNIPGDFFLASADRLLSQK